MRAVTLVSVCLALTACASPRTRPPTVCEQVDAECRTTVPPPVASGGGGGDGGRVDGGTPPADASTAAEATGVVVLAQSIPRDSRDPVAPAVGWTVEPVPPGGPIRTTTDGEGRFALAEVPVVDGTYVLRAAPPAGSGVRLGAVAEFRPGAPGAMVGASNAALDAVMTRTGISVGLDRAHVVALVSNASGPVAGVRAQVASAAPNVAYDDGTGQLSAGVDRTGPAGTVALFNLDAPPGGRRVEVEFRRAVAPGDDAGAPVVYAVMVLPGHLTWIRVEPP